mgnify:CR=1 FL=1
MRYKVLVTAPYMQMVIDEYRHLLEEKDIELVIPRFQERFEEEELLDMVSDIDGVICGDDRFTAKVLDNAPKLKVLSKWGTGIDSIDQEACVARGVAVRNTPGAFNEPVSESVLGYMLCFARRLPWLDRSMRKGRWEKAPAVSLGESVLGVIGVGEVGKNVVRRAKAFGMNILGNDLVEMPADFLAASGIEMTSKEDLLARSDFVSMNCDLNPTSRHLISNDEFELMKPSSVIINAARGPIVDEAALINALEDREIAGAALDVYEVEPLPPESPLLKMDNVMLAPHNSNSSTRAWKRVHENTINNLFDVLEV